MWKCGAWPGDEAVAIVVMNMRGNGHEHNLEVCERGEPRDKS